MNNSSFTIESGLPEEIVVAAQDYLPLIATSTNQQEIADSAIIVAEALGTKNSYAPLVQPVSTERDVRETKLVDSFSRNIRLLVDKTWVEKSDEILKESLIARLTEFCKSVNEKRYITATEEFSPVLTDIVYLLFGQQSESDDFLEYAVRIDPEFGLFWLYACQLKTGTGGWSEEKCRMQLLLGMCFLANF